MQDPRTKQLKRADKVSQKGYMLMTMAASIFAVMGAAGLAVDLGRMYVARNESQSFVDSTCLVAAAQLNGTQAGLTNARAAATNSVNKWNFGKSFFTSGTMEFAKALSSNGTKPDSATWSANPGNAVGYAFVRLSQTVNVPMSFMQVVNAQTLSPVMATAYAGQVPVSTYMDGLLPFSPVAWDNSDTVNFGLAKGTLYTMRYPAPSNNLVVCSGDTNAPWISSLPSQDRGYWGSTSAAAIRGEIVDDNQVQPLTIGDPVPMVGGNKTTEGDALDERVREDTDPDSPNFTAYSAKATGNGRRIVGLPINSGPNSNFIAIGVRAFFLQKQGVYNLITGNDPICGEYIGSYVQAAGIVTAAGLGTGGFQVRLVQ